MSHARAQPRKGRHTAAPGGHSFSGCCPLLLLLLTLRYIVSWVTCRPTVAASRFQPCAGLVIEPCMVTTAQQRDKQQNKCLRVISHFITVSRYLSLLSISLSLSVCHISSTLSYFVSAAVINFAWQQQGLRDGAVCVRSFFFILRVYRNLKRQRR